MREQTGAESLREKQRSQDFRDGRRRIPALAVERVGGANLSVRPVADVISRHVVFLINRFLFRSADLAGLRCQLEGGS